MRAALFFWRATWRSSLRPMVASVVLCAVLGAVALASLAGARQTESAYGRYLSSINASDVTVNVPEPDLGIAHRVAGLPGIASSAIWVGFDVNPVVHGRVDYSFLTDGAAGSLDGEYFRQDRASVLEGRLPALGSTREVALTSGLAQSLGVRVGDEVTYQFENPLVQKPEVVGYATYRVVGIVEEPPVLVDPFDNVAGALFPPAATARHLGQVSFSWVGLRLDRGSAGIPALEQALAALSKRLGLGEPFSIRQLDTVHAQVQQAIRPQAVALGLFGAFVALALVVLVGQALAQSFSRSAPELAVLRALGTARLEAGLAIGLGGALAVLGGMGLALMGAFLLSPLGPVGPVRQFDPARGFQFDVVVLAGGGLAITLVVLGVLALVAWRAVRGAAKAYEPRPSTIARASAWLGLPVPAAVGLQHALGPAPSGRASSVRANLLGCAAAVAAVVTAVVFGASLNGLVSQPVRYGWNWDVLVQSEGGYGSWDPGIMDKLMGHQAGVSGWSTFSFAQLPIDGKVTPLLGLARHQGWVAPPTVSGRPLTGPGQIELGTVTLGVLGVHVGDQVTVGAGSRARRLRVVGVVTLPSVGLQLTDHVSLGRGAMLPEATLLSIQGFTPAHLSSSTSFPALPSTLAIDVYPGVPTAPLVARILAAEPDEVPGGMYQVPREMGAAIANDAQLGSQPLVLSAAGAAAVLLSIILTVLASARRRRRELAVLKALGLTRGQIRAVVFCQASALVVAAEVLGLLVGVPGGRWAWTSFASSVGVVPVTEVPLAALAGGLVALVVVASVLAIGPALVAAGTAIDSSLRSE